MLRAGWGRGKEGIAGGRAHRRAALVVLATLLAATAVGAFSAAQADAIFRAFSRNSPWNQTAVPSASSNGHAALFTDRPDIPMRISGTPDNSLYGSPVFFARRGDPVAPVLVTQPDWLPDGNTEWDGRPIPTPAGVRPAPGSDGHLTIVSADRRTAWEFFGCTVAGPSGFVARVVVQWNLGGPGYSDTDDETSARGSGTPLITTSLRAEEALKGFQHALGLIVPRVNTGYRHPATHSDGEPDGGALEYGMRFVLRHDYPVPADASVGLINLVYALKVYGVYIVDRGADFELKADFTHPDLWQLAGLSSKSLDIRPTDLLPAEIGTPPALPTVVSPSSRPGPPVVLLRATRRAIRPGARLHLTGRVRGALTGYDRVRFAVRIRGAWRYLMATKVRRNARFGAATKLERRRAGLVLRRLRVRPGQLLRVRASVRGFGRSNVVRVRLRR